MAKIVREENVLSILDDKNFKRLFEENVAESGVSAIGAPKREWYAAAEKLGLLHAFAARDDAGELVGYASVAITCSPHYSTSEAILDVVFVTEDYRETTLGARLLLACARCAKKNGASKLVLSAKKGTRFYFELKSNPKKFKEQHTSFEMEV